MRPYCVYICNKEELPEERKESIIVPIYKKGNKTDYVDYRGVSLLPTTYKILSNILLSRLTSYTDEFCGYRGNRPTPGYIYCITEILEENGNRVKHGISCL